MKSIFSLAVGLIGMHNEALKLGMQNLELKYAASIFSNSVRNTVLNRTLQK
jgi:hypothetical protein